MCSGGDSTAKAAEASQAAFTSTLQGAFSSAFSAQQGILGKLMASLTDKINNPQGFSPEEMALLKTNASDTVATQVRNAQMATSSAQLARGGPETGSGVAAQVAGEIAGAGVTETAREESGIDIASEQQKTQNYWNAIKGLTDVAQAENPTGIANAESGSANATADLSRAVLASQQAGWQNAFGIVSGIAGLGSAAVGGLNMSGFFGGSKSGTGGNV